MSPPPLEIQGVLLGAVQGITEFLPISSSAHLVALPELLGWPYLGKTFDVSLHLGTLAALLSHYRGEVGELSRAFGRLVYRCGRPRGEHERTVLLILVASFPGAVAGFLLDGLVEHFLQGLGLVAVVSLVWGLLLAWADGKSGASKVSRMSWRQALLVGCAQMAALLPGTSRSGATMTAGMTLGLHRAEAARFSMLCSIPIVAGAVLYKGAALIGEWPAPELLRAMVCGALASALIGKACLRGFLRYLEGGTFRPFALYRVVFGLGLLLWLAFG